MTECTRDVTADRVKRFIFTMNKTGIVVAACLSLVVVFLANRLAEADKLTRPLMLHIAEEDQFVPKEAQAMILQALKNHVGVEVHTYPGRDHAFARPGGEHYHEADAMLAGGAEATICPIGIAGFAQARALSTNFNDQPEKASRPYDKDRDGFVLGEGAVLKAGLFDERFHPIYFEDNDYERRLEKAGVKAKFIYAALKHDNSSTLASGFHSQNDLTFQRNHKLFEQKVAEQDFTEGNWDLQIRRVNSWEK